MKKDSITTIEVSELKALSRQYMKACSDNLNEIIKRLEKEGISTIEYGVDNSTFASEVATIVQECSNNAGIFTYGRDFFDNFVCDARRFYKDSKLFEVIAKSSPNISFKKAAEKLQKHFNSVYELEKFTKLEFCQELKECGLGNKNIINTVDLMIEYGVTLADCKNEHDMREFSTLLTEFSTSNGRK